MPTQLCVISGHRLGARAIEQAQQDFPQFAKVLFIAYYNCLALKQIWCVHVRHVPLQHNDRFRFVNDTRSGIAITDILAAVGDAFVVTADVDALMLLCKEEGMEVFEYVPMIQPGSENETADLSDQFTRPMGSSG
ncbi:hypothetical protein A2704_03710 [Candidatus Kaiserbacteria bacterium RIFCSPHIGHO2_01_FULL_54_36b]|uniref:Uncharacterized protein n=1 Tax=Candidatus Kaiserbacteria bacterium RIFCSPHIGHO2_01_FULL_54_36b TaxID=1798483 RepID=A0A1F6CJR9_9BACT|nr:MAG: hypothetical protein A2704_03710 [Candidatus Kaiserbacteria bacterium RIFCSPHIGHO2_01_FULL_54_36b]